VEEKEKERQSQIPLRLNVLFFIVFIFFAAIILRLAYVQLVEGEQYVHELEKFSIRELPISAPRGRILDRNGVVLVSNKPVYSVQYVEEQGQDIDEEKVAERLAEILTPDDKQIGTDKELLKKTIELSSTLPVAFNAQETQQLIERIAEKLKGLPGVSAIDEMSDTQLVKTALDAGLRVRSPFTEQQEKEVRAKLKASSAAAGTDLDNLSSWELYKLAVNSGMKLELKLDEEDRRDLVAEVKAQLKKFPAISELSAKSDMDLLRYASLLDMDITLPLTDEQRLRLWHKLSLLQEMKSPHLASYIPRRIKENITAEEMFQIEERRTELPGISVELEPVRQIIRDVDGSPFGTHFLGYINSIRPENLKEYLAQGYNAIDRVGVTGLESYYERYLRGKDGVMEVKVNKNSETVEKHLKQPAQPGNDLVLAMDWRFQSRVEAILKEEVEKFKALPSTPEEFKDAHVLVMNPNTGEILAMASYPDYDLNLYYDRKAFNENYASLILPNESNRFIYSTYPPASTYKPLSVMIALQEGLTTPNEVIYDSGRFKVGSSYKHNWKPGGHGAVNARRALQVSNNTYMYAMAVRLANRPGGWQKQFSVLDYYNAQFGLGVKTGIDLPGESSGWENPYLYYGNLADAMIGQYDLFTPIQIAQYVSAIANGGYRVRPHLVKEIRRGTTDPQEPGQTLAVIEPQILNRVTIDPKYIQVVKEGMFLVTQPGGTASRNFVGLPFRVAAKTGTAQTGRRAENAMLVGFAPYENPQLVFVVVAPNSLRDGASSNTATGPIARRILEAYNELYPGVLTSASPAPATNPR